MNILFSLLLAIHIACGTLGLFTGTINLIQKKGGKWHRLFGKLFVVGMFGTGFTAFALSILHPNYFLFIVGVFTVYLAGTGYRYMNLKQLLKSQKPSKIDWTLTIGMLLAGLVFAGLGVYNLVNGKSFGIVFLAFSLISLGFVRTDYSNYRGKAKEKNYWLLAHIQRMVGAFIASATAFLVVNLKYMPDAIPPALVWLFPTIVLTPLIFVWCKKYRSSSKTKVVVPLYNTNDINSPDNK